MTLEERLARLEPRERRLLFILVAVVVTFAFVLLPVATWTWLGSQRAENAALREAIAAIHRGRAQIAQWDAKRAAVTSRYASPAPPLAGYLESLAKQHQLEIPESQDRPAVPHGKEFEERSTKITLRRVSMLPLAKFLEGIATSGHPLVISELNLRKRGPDSYDVTLVVSAFDRKAKPKPAKASTPDGDDAGAPEEGP